MLEVRIDGVEAEQHPDFADALSAANSLKHSLPEQLITVHDLRTGRAWVVDDNGMIYPTDYPRPAVPLAL